MTRTLALILAIIMLAAALAGCAAAPAAPAAAKKGLADVPQNAEISPWITLTSSDAADAAAWLTARLDAIPDRVVLGTDADAYGVDVAALEDDGYFIRSLGGEVALLARTADGLDRAARRYAKTVEGGTAVADETYHEGYRIKRIELAGRDISEYTVYAENEANILRGAKDLAAYVKTACGASLAVSTAEPAAPYIALRYVHDESLSTCGYRWSVTEDGLTLECSDGYKPSAAYCAVTRFLETRLGWFGLSFGFETLECADLISIGAGESGGEANAFRYVNMAGDLYSYADAFKRPLPTLSAIPNACHGLQNNKFGGGLSNSPDKNWAWDQPCWLDEDFLEDSVEDILKYIENQLAAGRVIGEDFAFVDVAHGDNADWCWCKKCTKMYNDEGFTHSAHIVTWANAMIEEINKTYPGLNYGIFGYQGTNKPPKTVRPCDQIYVTYCYDVNCSAHSLDGANCTSDPVKNLGLTDRGEHGNKAMSAYLAEWLGMTGNVYVWYYGLMNGFSTMSFVHTVRDDITFLHDIGVKGIVWESEDTGFSTGKISKWLSSGLVWNVGMSDEEYEVFYRRVLCALYGGDAAPLVREYVDTQDRVYQYGDCMACWQFYDFRNHMSDVMYRGVADELFAIIESAIPLAGSKTEEDRLLRLSCENIYKTCATGYFYAYNAYDDERVAELKRRYELMLSRADSLGVDVTKKELVFVDWSTRIGYERDLELEAWTKNKVRCSDFNVIKPTRAMPEQIADRVAGILARIGIK